MQRISNRLTRRHFVNHVVGGAVAASTIGGASAAAQNSSDAPKNSSALPNGFPSHDPALAREVVGKAHFDLDTVKKLVEARPALARASWDWGFGDWESALGAASHVGRRDIAELLIAHGARPNIFTFAMFGQLDAVKAIITANPGIQRIHGPHGITLLAHAKAGGDAAKAVVDYLTSLGDADNKATNLPLDEASRKALLGEYRVEGEARGGVCNIIEQRNGALAFRFDPDGSARPLMHQGEQVFHPSGTPHVRIAIEGERMTIADGDIVLAARRR
jgi:hypothetical protein